jgi:hypothetical protein
MVLYITNYMYYVIDSALQISSNSTYRIGGSISDSQYLPLEKVNVPFQAVQSLIIPEKINSDDKFKYSR